MLYDLTSSTSQRHANEVLGETLPGWPTPEGSNCVSRTPPPFWHRRVFQTGQPRVTEGSSNEGKGGR